MRAAFFHLPKTGGTSLHEFLVSHYPKEKVCPERFRKFDRFRPDQLRTYDYFSAHMDYATLRRIPGPLYTITILREPKARLLSLYYFWRSHTWQRIEQANLGGPRKAKKLGLLEFLKLRSDGIPGNINNVYVRNLLGEHWTGPGGRLVLSDEEALRVAMRNLLTFDTVGFGDDMPRLFEEVTRTLKLDMPDPLPWALSSKDLGPENGFEKVAREEITPEIDAELDRLTRLDQVLYANAKMLFAAKD